MITLRLVESHPWKGDVRAERAINFIKFKDLSTYDTIHHSNQTIHKNCDITF
jgi:hypothetical protein